MEKKGRCESGCIKIDIPGTVKKNSFKQLIKSKIDNIYICIAYKILIKPL